MDLEAVDVLGVRRVKEVAESAVLLSLSVFVVNPEEDVPREKVSVTVGPGEEANCFSVVASVRRLVSDVLDAPMLSVK